MRIWINCSRKRIDGYDELIRINNREFNQFWTRMTRFTFNLHSASFELMEVPGGDEMKAFILSEGKALIIKIRCNEPNVYFDRYGSCLPVIQSIRIYEEGKMVMVDLEGYAHIECSHVIAKVEEMNPAEEKAVVFI